MPHPHMKLFFASVDVETLPGLTVTDMSGVFAPGTRRADADLIPGRQGRLGSTGPYDSYAFAVPVMVDGANLAAMVANIRAAGDALQAGGGLGPLTRWLPNGSGHDVYTAVGQFVEFNSLSLLAGQVGLTELTFVNLSGAWQNAAGAWVTP